MTRLNSTHLESIEHSFVGYEQKLKTQINLSLFELVCDLLKIDESQAKNLCQTQKLAIIPISDGEGLISGFSESLRAIAEHLGFKAHILDADKKGFSEFEQNQDYKFCIWANDTEYFAEHKNSCRVDNNVATAQGFAHILHLFVKNNNPKAKILIRGCGPIGSNAAKYLSHLGYSLYLYDLDLDKANNLAKKLTAECIVLDDKKLEDEISNIIGLFDAAPVSAKGSLIGNHKFSYIVAPCVPCEWKSNEYIWHDVLQLGTAVMLMAACSNNNLTLRKN